MMGPRTRKFFSNITEPIAKGLTKLHITANSVTIFGTICTIFCSIYFLAQGKLFVGALWIWFFTMFDMLDGAVAKIQGGGTQFGAFLDATCDRFADGAVFGSLIWYIIYHSTYDRSILAGFIIVIVLSQVISYIKAKAEASGLKASGGIMERPERLIVALMGAGFTGLGFHYSLIIATWILVIGCIITVFTRTITVYNSANALKK